MTISRNDEDRIRLLKDNEINFKTYSHNDPRLVAIDLYLAMGNSAIVLGLKLTEPVYEIEPIDSTGGRYITVRAGVLDALTNNSD